ncbi:MAG: hydroxymethylbilane synthase, partial [Gammaproteobacteria bacterium]|nr:hydroxymethylbilane synthase [Gammaproteobacteria bacterium]
VERAMNLRLAGSCQVPIAGYCTEADGSWTLRALVGDERTGEILRVEDSADAGTLHDLGTRVAERLLEQGAERLLKR